MIIIGHGLVVGSRSLHWERGLKRIQNLKTVRAHFRSLHWERGLKRRSTPAQSRSAVVAPFIGSVD